jgi:hypothetical protein
MRITHWLCGLAFALMSAAAAAGQEPARPAADAVVSGTVVEVETGRPLAHVRVRIIDGPQMVTDERGAWTLAGVPIGTQLVEVRAAGYEPVQRAIDVTERTPPLRIALTPIVVALAPVVVTARARSPLVENGFEERRRQGLGHFLTSEDLERRNLRETSDVFATIPGLIFEPRGASDRFFMRSAFGERCVPAVFVDGHKMENLAANQLDVFVYPHEIAAIEVYSESQAPPQFQAPMSGCGSIVIWTR